MKRSILAILLTLALLLPAALPAASASYYDKPLPFSDVTYDDTFFEAVAWALETGVTEGVTPTTFSPGSTCTRAQVVTFLWRAKGEPEPASSDNSFEDVAPGIWYEKPVLWAVEQGITNGTTDVTFSPDELCTYGHILTFLWRANGEPEPAPAAGITADWDPFAWYTDAVTWAEQSGILGIEGSGLNPNVPCSRGVTVTFLYNEALQNGEVPVEEELLTVQYVETREEAEALGASAFHELPLLPSDEPNPVWAVIAGQFDDVHYAIRRVSGKSEEEALMSRMYGPFPELEPVLEGDLDVGECVAIQVNRPWYPSYVLSASMGRYSLVFPFQARRVDDPEGDMLFLFGHDLNAEARGTEYYSEKQLRSFLADGIWVWRNEATGEYEACIRFNKSGEVDLYTREAEFNAFMSLDRLYAEDTEAPDLLVLEKYAEQDSAYADYPQLSGLSLGDYLITAEQQEGVQVLRLDQANNGDGILSYILPDSEYSYGFTFYRFIGTPGPEAMG